MGAEAMQEGIYETAEDEDWIKAEWFKLHLRPRSNATQEITGQLPPLPPGKSVLDVLADFLRYLFKCARTYIEETHANGVDLWLSVEKDIEFVLSHPNGWEGAQQTQMRKAAALAGLIPDNQGGYDRIAFVTEGEASLHFSIRNGLPSSALKEGDGVVIVDAGGGTIDISAYARNPNVSTSFDEIAAPQCHFHGSIFVSIHARLFLERLLSESPFLDDLDHIVRCFDKTTKLRFRNSEEPQFIKFGGTRDNEPDCNIRYGQLKLTGAEVAEFFEPSIKCIVESVREQRKTGHKKFSNVILVGGFAASDWLYTKVSDRLKPDGFTVIRPDNHVNKAVADGALSYYIDHHVKTRVSKITYGSRGGINYDASNTEHSKRSHLVLTSISGIKRLGGIFWVLLPTNTQVSETKEFRRAHYWEFDNLSGLSTASTAVWGYKGTVADAAFMDVNTSLYSQLCTIEVDLSHLKPSPKSVNASTSTYYKVDYELIMLFGGTELKAQLAWKENGVEKRSAAKIVYSD